MSSSAGPRQVVGALCSPSVTLPTSSLTLRAPELYKPAGILTQGPRAQGCGPEWQLLLQLRVTLCFGTGQLTPAQLGLLLIISWWFPRGYGNSQNGPKHYLKRHSSLKHSLKVSPLRAGSILHISWWKWDFKALLSGPGPGPLVWECPAQCTSWLWGF